MARAKDEPAEHPERPLPTIRHMYEKKQDKETARKGAVGIVVQSGAAAARAPRAVAFVWGGKVRPTPSLPYGRWKTVRTAA